MQQTRLKILNGKVITPHRLISGGTVVAIDGKIQEVAGHDIELPGARVIDAAGKYVSPGFIDIHVHGGGGYDFMDGSQEAFLKIAQTHARHGTTSMVPTTLSSDKKSILQTLMLYEQAEKNNHLGAQFLGMHLEGPYFAMNQRGAQDPRYIRDPDPAEYTEIIERSQSISRWSSAPELKGAIAFGRYLMSKGILPAIAHTDAVYEEVLEAYESGYSLITHLYSGMSGITRRKAYRCPGVIESAYIIEDMAVEIIADGRHLPAALLGLVYRLKGADKIALITDAMRAAGTACRESILGSASNGLKVIIEDGVAKFPDRSAFAGSVATAEQLVYNMVTLAGVPLLDAVKMMTVTPATIMKVNDRKGSLLPGKDADIVIFDENIRVEKTFVKGELVYAVEDIL